MKCSAEACGIFRIAFHLFIAILDGLVSRIGLAYLFGFFLAMGPRGFWYGDALAGFVPLIVGGTYYLTGRWKRE